MHNDLLIAKYNEMLELITEVDQEKLLTEEAKKYFIDKYIYLEVDEIYSENVAQLYIKGNNVTTAKVGNIVFNFKTSVLDAICSVIGTGKNIYDICISNEESERIKKVINLIIGIITEFSKLQKIKLADISSELIITLIRLGADKAPVPEEQIRNKIIDKTKFDLAIKELCALKCIDIVDGKIVICESIKYDWIK